MIALFKSCGGSLLRSILTIGEREKNPDPDLPDNILDIIAEKNIKEVVLIEDSISSYMQANLACQKEGVKLIFGLRTTFVEDSKNKTESSWASAHKNVIFPKNKQGYKQLIKISTLAAYDNFYKEPRLSYEDLHNFWTDDLALSIPFYDSFLHKNLLASGLCVPDYRGIKPTVFIERNNLPWDWMVEEAAVNFAKTNGLETVLAKSIYYKDRKDFDAYLTLKCLNRKQFGSGRTLDAPDFEHMSSREFCWESYLEEVGK